MQATNKEKQELKCLFCTGVQRFPQNTSLPTAATALELYIRKHLLHLHCCFTALLSQSQSAQRKQLMCCGEEEGMFYPCQLITKIQVISLLH